MAESHQTQGDTTEDRSEHTWYQPDLTTIPESARAVLEKYSQIPPDRVVEHVKEVRDRAYKVHPYPCIGGFRFLDFGLPQSPYYQEILSRLKSGEKLLDLGCAFGQELRLLIFEEVPAENLYGSDLRPEFLDIGYDLFRDRDKFKSDLIIADVFDDNSDLVRKLAGQIDIINTGSFFHLFDWDQQMAAAKRVTQLLRPRPGSLLVGRQVGLKEPGVRPRVERASTAYRHNVDSWKKFWDQVGKETGTAWQVDARAEEWRDDEIDRRPHHNGSFRLRFAVRRA